MLSDPQLYTKPEVMTDGVCREVWFAVGVFYATRDSIVSGETTITSMHDGAHMAGSLHYTGHAVDLRTHDVTPAQEALIAWIMKDVLSPLGFDVVLETAPRHLHIEFDPKPGRTFLRPEPTTPPVTEIAKVSANEQTESSTAPRG